MGDNYIFSVFSNIWSSVRLKIPPQFQASRWQRLFTLDMANLKKNDSFSFYLSIAVLVFLYLNAAYASIRQCVIIICRCPQNIEIYLSRKNVHRSTFVCCQKCQKCNNLFLLNFKGLSKKKKKLNIYTRILDIMKL